MILAADIQASPTVQILCTELDPPAVQPLLIQFLDGKLSASVALMYLLIETRSLERVSAVVNTLSNRVAALEGQNTCYQKSLAQLVELIRQNHQGCERITEMLRSNVDSDEPAPSIDEGIAFCKRLFDWSVQQCAEASVALYSLGNPEILAAVTAEVVAKMQEWELLNLAYTVLEIGCGIGRFQSALATKLHSITGIDVSAKMIETARTRCAGIANVHLSECSGHDLSQFPDQSFDLVFAVDSFPYLCQSGMPLVETHFSEAARVLKPHGHLLILNFSYRDSLLTDSTDVNRLATTTGFDVVLDGERPFSLWDGTAFHLRLR